MTVSRLDAARVAAIKQRAEEARAWIENGSYLDTARTRSLADDVDALLAERERLREALEGLERLATESFDEPDAWPEIRQARADLAASSGEATK